MASARPFRKRFGQQVLLSIVGRVACGWLLLPSYRMATCFQSSHYEPAQRSVPWSHSKYTTRGDAPPYQLLDHVWHTYPAYVFDEPLFVCDAPGKVQLQAQLATQVQYRVVCTVAHVNAVPAIASNGLMLMVGTWIAVSMPAISAISQCRVS